MKKCLLFIFGKRRLFNILFSVHEQTTIINSLYRRSNMSDNEWDKDCNMSEKSKELAKKLMEL